MYPLWYTTRLSHMYILQMDRWYIYIGIFVTHTHTHTHTHNIIIISLAAVLTAGAD